MILASGRMAFHCKSGCPGTTVPAVGSHLGRGDRRILSMVGSRDRSRKACIAEQERSWQREQNPQLRSQRSLTSRDPSSTAPRYSSSPSALGFSGSGASLPPRSQQPRCSPFD